MTKGSLREKCSNTEVLLIRIFLYSDQKKLRIWTCFTQWVFHSSHFSSRYQGIMYCVYLIIMIRRISLVTQACMFNRKFKIKHTTVKIKYKYRFGWQGDTKLINFNIYALKTLCTLRRKTFGKTTPDLKLATLHSSQVLIKIRSEFFNFQIQI